MATITKIATAVDVVATIQLNADELLKAVEVLIELMNKESVEPQVRLEAAIAVLEYGGFGEWKKELTEMPTRR